MYWFDRHPLCRRRRDSCCTTLHTAPRHLRSIPGQRSGCKYTRPHPSAGGPIRLSKGGIKRSRLPSVTMVYHSDGRGTACDFRGTDCRDRVGKRTRARVRCPARWNHDMARTFPVYIASPLTGVRRDDRVKLSHCQHPRRCQQVCSAGDWAAV